MVPERRAVTLLLSIHERCFWRLYRRLFAESERVARVWEHACPTGQPCAWRAVKAGSKRPTGLFYGDFAESRGAFSCDLLQRCCLRSESGRMGCRDLTGAEGAYRLAGVVSQNDVRAGAFDARQ